VDFPCHSCPRLGFFWACLPKDCAPQTCFFNYLFHYRLSAVPRADVFLICEQEQIPSQGTLSVCPLFWMMHHEMLPLVVVQLSPLSPFEQLSMVQRMFPCLAEPCLLPSIPLKFLWISLILIWRFSLFPAKEMRYPQTPLRPGHLPSMFLTPVRILHCSPLKVGFWLWSDWTS